MCCVAKKDDGDDWAGKGMSVNGSLYLALARHVPSLVMFRGSGLETACNSASRVGSTPPYRAQTAGMPHIMLLVTCAPYHNKLSMYSTRKYEVRITCEYPNNAIFDPGHASAYSRTSRFRVAVPFATEMK